MIKILHDSPILSKRIVRFGNWIFDGRWHWKPLVSFHWNGDKREHYIRGHEAKKFARMAEEL